MSCLLLLLLLLCNVVFGISVFLESHKNHCYVTFRYVALRVTLRFVICYVSLCCVTCYVTFRFAYKPGLNGVLSPLELNANLEFSCSEFPLVFLNQTSIPLQCFSGICSCRYSPKVCMFKTSRGRTLFTTLWVLFTDQLPLRRFVSTFSLTRVRPQVRNSWEVFIFKTDLERSYPLHYTVNLVPGPTAPSPFRFYLLFNQDPAPSS